MSLTRTLVIGMFLLSIPVVSDAERVVLVAGGSAEVEPVRAELSKLTQPFAVDFDSAGNMYIAEMTGEKIRVVNREGLLSTYAGTGEKGASGDGKEAYAAKVNGVHHLAVDAKGDLYVADTWNHRIRKIDSRNQMISAFAGTGKKGFAGDGGPALKALFGGIYCLAFSADGKRLYVADLDNRRIRKIDLATGIVSTVAGNGKKGVPKDGAKATEAPLVDPRAVAVDKLENIYILERGGDALRVVDPNGFIRTLVGPGAKECVDEEGKAPAPMKGPKHLCVDLEGNILIADTENHSIRKYLPAEKKLIRVAGTGQAGNGGVNGPPLAIQLNKPHGVLVHPNGTIYISDSSNGRVLKIEK
ncbi:MAG: hypothetical protein U1D30_20370 [Planctomycetota bacterium]